MRLLVSVASAAEASAALSGGVDVIDAKDPYAGALGAVSLEVLHAIRAVVAGVQPVSAALGDATDEAAIARDAHRFVSAGASFVKVGFGGITRVDRIGALTAAAVHGARSARTCSTPTSDRVQPRRSVDGPSGSWPDSFGGGVIAVAYADVAPFAASDGVAFVEVAARAGAAGVLLDTTNKHGPGLRGLITPSTLAAWVGVAHEAGLLVALAGKLTADDLGFVRDAGADIAGVRGAACDDGRTGRVTVDKVRALRLRLGEPFTRPAPQPDPRSDRPRR
jgi:hypothetical protein